MPRTPVQIVAPQAFPTSTTVVSTTSASTKDVIRHIHISNPTGSAVTVTVQIDNNAGGDAAAERIFDAYSVAAGATLDHYGAYPLDAAATIRAHASSASATLTITGDRYTVG